MTDVMEVREAHAAFCQNPLHMGPCTKDEGGPGQEIAQAQQQSAGAKAGSKEQQVAAQAPQLVSVPLAPDAQKKMLDQQRQAQNAVLAQTALSNATKLASDLGIKGHPAVALYGRALSQQYQAIAEYNRQVQLAQDAHDNAQLRNEAIVNSYKARLAAAKAADAATAAKAKLQAAAKKGGQANNDAAIKKALQGAQVFKVEDSPVLHFELMRSAVETFAVQRFQSRMYDMGGEQMLALVAGASWDFIETVLEAEHTYCEPGTFCRNPLHPGPCKGWKHTLHAIAPGAYHALEKARVEKLNEKRKAKIKEFEAAGKKVPKYLLKPITYDPAKLAPPPGGFTPPTEKEAAAAIPATAKEIGAKIAMKHEAINAIKKSQQLDAAATMFQVTAQALGVSGATNKQILIKKLEGAWADSGEAKLHDVPMVEKTAEVLATKAGQVAGGLPDLQVQKIKDDIIEAARHGDMEVPASIQAALHVHKQKELESQLKMEKAAHLSHAETLLESYGKVKDWENANNEGRSKALAAMQKIIDDPHTTEGQKNKAGQIAADIHLGKKKADQLADEKIGALQDADTKLAAYDKINSWQTSSPKARLFAHENLQAIVDSPHTTPNQKKHAKDIQEKINQGAEDAAKAELAKNTPEVTAAKKRFDVADEQAQETKPAFEPTAAEKKTGVGSVDYVSNAAKPDPAKLKLVGHAEQGVSKPAIYQDEHGQRWLFKPLQESGDGFRVDVDVQAAALQRKLGLPGPATYDLKINGKRGSLQAMFDAKDAFKANEFDPAKLSARDVGSLQAEHVLDWLIGNNDSHSGNFLRTTDGQLVGIDKTHGFRYYRDDKLDPDYAPGKTWPQHARTYSALYKAFAEGKDVKLESPLEGPSGEAIKKAMSIPDAQLKDMFRPTAEHIVASGYAVYGKKYSNADQLLNDLVARKKNLAKDFGALYEKAWKARQDKLHAPGAPAEAPKVEVPNVPTHTESSTVTKASNGGAISKANLAMMAVGGAASKVDKASKISKEEFDSLPETKKAGLSIMLKAASLQGIAAADAQLKKFGLPPATPPEPVAGQPAHIKHALDVAVNMHEDLSPAEIGSAIAKITPEEWKALPVAKKAVILGALRTLHEAGYEEDAYKTANEIDPSGVAAAALHPDGLLYGGLPNPVKEPEQPLTLVPSLQAKLVALEHVVNDPEVSQSDKVDMVASWSPEMYKAATPSQKAAAWVVLTQEYDDGNTEASVMLANHLDPSGKLAASIANQPLPKAGVGEMTDVAKEAHAIANKQGFVMLKAKLPMYEALGPHDFQTLDPATQQKVLDDLDAMAIKLKDPKKLKSAAGLKAMLQGAKTNAVPDSIPVEATPSGHFETPEAGDHIAAVLQALQEEAGYPHLLDSDVEMANVLGAQSLAEYDKHLEYLGKETAEAMVSKVKIAGVGIYLNDKDEKQLKTALTAEHIHMLQTGDIGSGSLTEQVNEQLDKLDDYAQPQDLQLAADEIMSLVHEANTKGSAGMMGTPTPLKPTVVKNVDGPSPIAANLEDKASQLAAAHASLMKLSGQKAVTPAQQKKLVGTLQAQLAAGMKPTIADPDHYMGAWVAKHVTPLDLVFNGGDKDKIISAAEKEMAYMIEHGLPNPPEGGVLATAKKAYKKKYTKKWGLLDASTKTPYIVSKEPAAPAVKASELANGPSQKIAAPVELAPTNFDPATWKPKGAKTVVEETPSEGGGTGSPEAYVAPKPIAPDAAKYHAAYKAAAGLFGSLGSKTTVADFQTQIAQGSQNNYIKTIADVFAKKFIAMHPSYIEPGEQAAIPQDFEDMIRGGLTTAPAGSTLAKVQAAKIKAGESSYAGYGVKGHASQGNANLLTGNIEPGGSAGFITYHDGAIIQDHPDPVSGGYGGASGIKQVVEAGEESSVAAYNAKLVKAAHGGTAQSHTPLSLTKLKGMTGQKLGTNGATVAAAHKAFYEYSGEGSHSYSSINPFLRQMAKKYMTATSSSSQGEQIVDAHQAWEKAAAEASSLSPTASEYVQKQVANMDAAYEHSRLTHDTVIYRGTGGSDVFGPAWDADQSLVGYEYVEPSYASASTNYSTAHSFAGKGGQAATVFRVFAPKGTPGISLVGGQFSGESEILLKRGMRYRVIADNGWQNGRRQLDVEIIGWT